MNSKFTDKDQGYKKVLALLTSGTKPVVKVGVFGAKAAETHLQEKPTGGSLTVGEIATIHEFGLGTCPERSFIRGWCDENEGNVVNFLAKESQRAITLKMPNFDQGLERLGLFCVSGIQVRIANGIPPALKQATIDRKGSSTPLINTGQLRSSITYEVIAEGGK